VSVIAERIAEKELRRTLGKTFLEYERNAEDRTNRRGFGRRSE